MTVSTHDIIARLEALIAEMRTADAPAVVDPVVDPPVRVAPGDNLPDLIAQSDGTRTFVLADEYTYGGTTLDIAKPCAIVGDVNFDGRPNPDRRSQPRMPVLTVGKVRMRAPGVTLARVLIKGTNPNIDGVVEPQHQSTLRQVLVDGGAAGVRRGVLINAQSLILRQCAIVNIFHGQEAQAVCGWQFTRNVQIEDCLLQSSGPNVLIGGADPPTAADSPTEVLVTGCELSKPLTWRTTRPANAQMKGLFEIKNGTHISLTDSLLDGCWGGQGQSGYAVLLTVRNQDGRAPWSTIEDVDITDNVIRNTASGVQVLGRDDRHPSGRMTNVSIDGNELQLDPQQFGGRGDFFFISGGPRDLTIARNRGAGRNTNAFIYFDQPQFPVDGLRVTDNDMPEGAYGVFSSAGLGVRALSAHAPGHVWRNNTLHKTQTERWINYPAAPPATAS